MTYEQWHEEFVENNPEATLVEKMQKNKATDRKQYEEYKKILGKEGSKSLDSFQELKYTNVKEWNAKRREYATISKVNQKQWSDDFKKKAIGAYYQFKKADIEISDHGLARFLDRSKGKIPYTFEDIMKQFKMPVNYVQNDGNEIRFYNERAVISSPDTHEIITIVNRKTISKEWKRSHE